MPTTDDAARSVPNRDYPPGPAQIPAYGWIFWPWKRIPEASWANDRFRPLMTISSSKDWDTVRKFVASIFGLKKIPIKTARQGLADFIEASKAENLVADERMVKVLQSWRPAGGAVPAPAAAESASQK